MKTIIKNGFRALLGCVLALTGCNSDPELYTLPVPDDQMQLSISSQTLTLQRRDADQVAARFTWNDATERGDGEIVYYFRIYRTADKTQSSELIKIDKGQRSLDWTTRQLNDLIASWGILPGDQVDVTAEMIAKVVASHTYFKPELSLCNFQITGYNPANVMYIIVEPEVGPLRAMLMSQTDEEGVFTWKGTMSPCEFRFSADTEKGWPAYMQGEEENTLIEVNSKEDEGVFFTCEQESAYEIRLDINTMNVTLSTIPIYHLSLIITSTDGSERVVELTDQEIGSDWFYFENRLTQGQTVRIVRDLDTPCPALTLDGDVTVSEVEGQAGTYAINSNHLYAISVLPSEGKLILKRLWWTGTCAPVGDVLANCPDWNAWECFHNEANQFKRKDLKYHPHIYYLTTQFKNANGGEGFKILTTDNYWNEFVPKNWNGINPFTEGPSNGWTHVGQRGVGDWWSFDNDWKWHPRYEGTATIELDVNQMKLRMVK